MEILVDPPQGVKYFDPPLSVAKSLMEKYQNSFDSFVLVMSTDGEAPYPSAAVENIRKSPVNGKLKFKAFAMGKGSDSLTRIEKELGCNWDRNLDPSKLSKRFF